MSDDTGDSVKSNQFIRPKFDLVSAAARLALRGEGFADSAEFSDAISTGVGPEFGMALMDALVERINACNSDDLCAVADLISARRCSPDEADAGAEAPGALADAKVEHGVDVGRSEYD